jgi:hypothetical protein
MSVVKEVWIISQLYSESKHYLEQLLPHVVFRVVTPSCYSKEDGKLIMKEKLTEEDVEQFSSAKIVILDNTFLPDVCFNSKLPNLKWAQCTYAGLETSLPTINKMIQDNSGSYPTLIASRFSGEKYGQMMLEYCLSFMIGEF